MASRLNTHPRRGHTLVELIVSIAVMATIMVGIASALVLASKTLPDRSTPAAAVSKAGEVADQILGELTYALSVLSQGPRSIAFTVADRNGDNLPERIEYTWSGTAGDPLTRKYNDDPLVTLLANVQEFRLTYATRSERLPPSYSDGPEFLLAPADQHFLTRVQLALRAGDSPGTQVDSAIHVLSQPQVTP